MVIQLEPTRICGTGYLWTEKEIEIVKKCYKGNKQNVLEIQKQLKYFCGVDRSTCAISKMAQKLDLTRRRICYTWSENDDILLENMAGSHTAQQIATKLKKSIHSVYHRASEKHICLYIKHDIYSVQRIADMLGVWENTVLRWIKEKSLKAIPHDHKTHWQISREDLRDFIINHPVELTGRNLDMLQIVDILTST